MRTRTPILLTTAALAVAAAAPSTAAADKIFTGKTQQRRTVSMRTGDDDVLKSVRINWITRRCSLTGSRFQHITRFIPKFDASAPGSFTDAGGLTVRQRGGIRSRLRLSVTGTHPTPETWSGSIRASVVVRRNGRVIDRCTLRRTYWTATFRG